MALKRLYSAVPPDFREPKTGELTQGSSAGTSHSRSGTERPALDARSAAADNEKRRRHGVTDTRDPRCVCVCQVAVRRSSLAKGNRTRPLLRSLALFRDEVFLKRSIWMLRRMLLRTHVHSSGARNVATQIVRQSDTR